MKTLEELKKKEERILMATLGASGRSLEELKNTIRFVFDENGEVIEQLPGIGTLEEFGIGTYRKQFNAALRSPLVRSLRNSWDRLVHKDETRQEMLRHSHALKLDLGKDWKRFYANLLIGENNQGLLKHLAELGIIDDNYIKELTKNTGWVFNRNPLPIYETKVDQCTKQALANDGGLYKVILEVRPDEFHTFFAKKHGKKSEFENTLRVQPLLAEITGRKVGPVIAVNRHNEITVEPFIKGETLTQSFARTANQVNTTKAYLENSNLTLEEREKELGQSWELQDKARKDKLKPALDELIEISADVEKHSNRFDFLDTYGKGGKSFTNLFAEKYVAKTTSNADKTVLDLISRHVTSYMDEEDTVFCHGDAHTDNVIEQLHKPRWIDWEYSRFSIPQLEDAKLLKKAGLGPAAEDEVVRHSCMKRDYGKSYEHYRMVYDKSRIFDFLLSAAKYHKLSRDSRKQGAAKQAQADIYFTDALSLIEQDKTMEREAQRTLVNALEEASRGRLSRLDTEEYLQFSGELDPHASPSIENLGTQSIMEKYSRPPLTERLGKVWRKHKVKIATGITLLAASVAGKFVYDDVKAEEARQLTKIERTSQYYADIEQNEKLMPFVEKYAGRYDNVNPDELAAVINSAFQYNSRVADFLLDYRQNPEPWAHDAGVKKKRESFRLKSGLSEEQSFVKEEHLEDPENNVFAAAKRLSDMKKLFPDIEDAVLAFYTSPEFVEKWKEKAGNYWDYSKEKEFEWSDSFKHNYKTLTDRAIANLGK
ncbi:phosphotransferase [Candidatus Woesearchaeota archaeon]|nr:phosphotransferase [Candidatus Woesearchaeota archaeon]